MSTTVNGNGNGNHLGLVDTSLTKVFVGGLAWETPKDALRQHFERYGHILEAVIISDKLTGRSKGYGFVTFSEAEAAAKACEDAAPLINGRRANCNLASLGAKRDKHPSILLPTLSPISSSPPPHNNQQAIHNNTAAAAATITNVSGVISVAPVHWYYPAPATPYQPPPHHHHQQHVSYFGFPPPPAAYVAPNMNYNQKLGVYSGGFYSNGQVYPAAVMPVYPLYQYHNQSLRYGAHVFPAAHRLPAFIPKTPTFVPSAPPGAVVGV